MIGDDLSHFPGDDVREPVFGLPARWVPVEFRGAAEHSGNTVVDRSALVVTHLAEVIRRRAGLLLSRSDVKELLEGVAATDPAVVEDLSASGVTPSEVQAVLATLLDDGIAIRDLVRILEAIGDRARTIRSHDALVEAARHALGPAITSSYATDGVLPLITIAPPLEAQLAAGFEITDAGAVLQLGPDFHGHVVAELERAITVAAGRGFPAVVACAPGLRPAFGRLVRESVPGATVISYQEIGDHLEVDLIATIDPPALSAPQREDQDDRYAALS